MPCRLWVVCFVMIVFITTHSWDYLLEQFQAQVDVAQSSLDFHQNITIFYNVYTATPRDVPRVKYMVSEQTGAARQYHDIKVITIGVPWSINESCSTCEHMKHYHYGSELMTLMNIWRFCRLHQNNKVGYIHNKGSFHPSPANSYLRKFLTKGTLSEQCARLPGQCNVCSSHFSPMPHMHTPGNMWIARCSYVRELQPPLQFLHKMNALAELYALNRGKDAISQPSLGTGRYASEHWIHSHPSVRPCDLYDALGPLQSYRNMETSHAWEMKVQMAPREDLEFYGRGLQNFNRKAGWGWDRNAKLVEWQFLYGVMPTADSWIWDYYGTSSLVEARNKTPFSRLTRFDGEQLQLIHPNITWL